MEQPNLNEIERRPLKHWNVDGLPELLMGLLWLATGGAYAWGPSRGVFWMVVPLALVVAAVSAKWFLRRLKERITYPRAGYVQPRCGSRRIILVAIVVALITATTMLVRGGSSHQGRRPSMAVGIIVGGAFVLLTRRQNAPHLLWYAAAPPVIYICYYAARGAVLPVEWMFLILGGICTVGGAIRFARFLRNNPKQVTTGA